MKASMAGASISPAPRLLARAMAPPRTACTSPGTPIREAAVNSSGSQKSASSRRISTSIRFGPSMVRT